MPILSVKQKTDSIYETSMDIQGRSADDLLSREWLLTNTKGGYCSSSIIGCNTRRYHGLLIGSLNPPADRILALSNVLESIICDGCVKHFSTFEFDDKCSPAGFGYLKEFRRNIGAHFEYQLDNFAVTKSIYLARHSDTVLVSYKFTKVERPFEFAIRPFVGLRDFHALQKSYAPLSSSQKDQCVIVYHDVPGSCELLLNSPDMFFENDPQWWFNFVYRHDKERGQDFLEDLWMPGFYKCSVRQPCEIVFKAYLGSRCETDKLTELELHSVIEQLAEAQKTLTCQVDSEDKTLKRLSIAADQFICIRKSNHNHRSTVLAGYPWFFDWGRDAFISLPGLLLATGRFDDAKSVLTTFAAAVDEGMIPNRFDDRSDTAHFNSVDASLWFINAAFCYLKAADDFKTFQNQLLPTICQIVEAYQNGTRFEIHADKDGLISAGNENTQLTWMDAKCGGVAFTPRYGKAVEINALWYNALCRLAKYYSAADSQKACHYESMAQAVQESFGRIFWDDRLGYLNDCVYPDGTKDSSFRPNQIFAVSLEFSPLTFEQQRKIVEAVQQKLLTPFGLRSLSADDPKYKGRCIGSQKERDESYHQGTVWAYLIGPFIEAYLKINNFSPQSRLTAQKFIEPLFEHFKNDACLGGVSEIFDGDEPHTPRGCFTQAWSVAELIRAIQLIKS